MFKIKINISKNQFIALFIFILSFLWLTATTYRYCQFGDGPEYILMSYTNGIPHPPGYPLYLIFTKLAVAIFSFYPKAFVVNAVSAFFGAASLSVIYLLLHNIFKRFCLNLTAVLAFLFSGEFSYYSRIAEVFTLHVFISTIYILSLFKWQELCFKQNKLFNKYFLLASLFFGLGLSNNHTIALLIPASLWLIMQTFKKLATQIRLELKKTILSFATLLFFLFLGLSPYLYLVYLSRLAAPLVLANPGTVDGFLRMFFRSGYGFFKLMPNVERSISSSIFQFFNFFSKFGKDFNWPLALFILISICLYIFNRFNKYKQEGNVFFKMDFMLISLVVTGPLFFSLTSLPNTYLPQAVLLRKFMLLPSFIALFFLIYGLIHILKKFSKNKSWSKFPVVIILLFIFINGFNQTKKILDFKSYAPIKSYFTSIYTSLPDNAYLLPPPMSRDGTLIALAAYHFVLGDKNKVNLLPSTSSKLYLWDLLKSHNQLYVFRPPTEQLTGIAVSYIPHGYVFEVNLSDSKPTFLDTFKLTPKESSDIENHLNFSRLFWQAANFSWLDTKTDKDNWEYILQMEISEYFNIELQYLSLLGEEQLGQELKNQMIK